MEEKKGWLETRRYVCRKCGSSMIIESSGIRHWECTKCHTVNYEENYLENKLKQELDKAREEGKREVIHKLKEEIDMAEVSKFIDAHQDFFNSFGESVLLKISELTNK